MNHPHVRNIVLDIVLTLITCGLFNFYVQYKQCEAVNAMLKEPRYSFVAWLIFTLLTFGLYHIYHEYKKSSDIARVLGKDPDTSGLIAVVLTFFVAWFVNDAIQQVDINAYFGRQQQG